MPSFFRPIAPLLLLLAMACQPEAGHLAGADFDPTIRTRDPVILLSLVNSSDTPDAARENADRLLAEVRGAADTKRVQALEWTMAAGGSSDGLRIYAIDRLAAASPERLGQCLCDHLAELEGEPLAHACAWCELVAAPLPFPRLADALIESLSRSREKTPLEARPQWAAIAHAAGEPVDAALADRLRDSGEPHVRIAALNLLSQLHPTREIQQRTLALTPGDGWLKDLQWWIATFDALPAGTYEMQWIHTLHEREQGPLVAQALAVHTWLKDASDYAAAPRYVYVLAHTDAATAALSRAQLLNALHRLLDPLKHAERMPSYAGAPDDVDSSLAAQEKNLSRGDLLTIHLLLTALADPAAIAALHQQGLADLADAGTEHGGLLTLRAAAPPGPALVATVFPPLFQRNDLQYISSDDLAAQTPLGIAQYHFHFQAVDNSARAGPGLGDLAYVRAVRCNCVVITSVGAGAINVDYYTPGGAVVDLGVYHVR